MFHAVLEECSSECSYIDIISLIKLMDVIVTFWLLVFDADVVFDDYNYGVSISMTV